MLQTLKNLIPPGAKTFLRHARTVGRGRQCPLCEIELRRFLPLGAMYRGDLEIRGTRHSVAGFETLSLSNYECPRCSASDRGRLYYLYLEDVLDPAEGGEKRRDLIHFAPESSLLTTWLQRHAAITYRSADLTRADVDDRVDICHMPTYGDETFDIAICSHVLEHVAAPERAAAELFRILRRGGWAIVMVPILTTIDETHEDPSVTDEAGRWLNFGLGDHVRVFAKAGFVRLLTDAGFGVRELGVEHFGAERFWRAGIDAKAVLYIAEKPGQAP